MAQPEGGDRAGAGAEPTPYGDVAPWLVVDEEWCPWPGFTPEEWRRLVAFRRRIRSGRRAGARPALRSRRRAGRDPGRA